MIENNEKLKNEIDNENNIIKNIIDNFLINKFYINDDYNEINDLSKNKFNKKF